MDLKDYIANMGGAIYENQEELCEAIDEEFGVMLHHVAGSLANGPESYAAVRRHMVMALSYLVMYLVDEGLPESLVKAKENLGEVKVYPLVDNLLINKKGD